MIRCYSTAAATGYDAYYVLTMCWLAVLNNEAAERLLPVKALGLLSQLTGKEREIISLHNFK